VLADYHIHTRYSNDSSYPMQDMIEQAIRLGLNEICITEHADYLRNDLTYIVNYDEYLAEYRCLKAKYQDKIRIRFGVEFGVQMHTIKDFERDFAAYPFDFVILSNHQIDDQEFWTGEYQQGKTQREYNRGYYQAILDVISNFKSYSVLGHLDMIKRYDRAGILEDKMNEELIKDILKLAIADGKGLEVNTSCFRYGLPDLTPSRTILTWYYELGGTILTIGSDCHEESHLGKQLLYAREELRKIGFRQFCTFDRMNPIFHDL
jgi:histidinol-phosphatase (PHP family)